MSVANQTHRYRIVSDGTRVRVQRKPAGLAGWFASWEWVVEASSALSKSPYPLRGSAMDYASVDAARDDIGLLQQRDERMAAMSDRRSLWKEVQ